ncbi:hypothetical protein [Leptospira adleri]|uniref:hypothetical protein n=1 Tax=Leptospira adleri TaxID=2023186 RepID=UPI000F645178|nr:hypothetical protein [Leptospira adleri]
MLKDFLAFILGVYTVCIAKEGLKTWKEQIRGGNNYQLAKRILIKLNKLRNELRKLRSPIRFAKYNEFLIGAPDEFKETIKEEWRGVSNSYAELEFDIYEAGIVFGEEFKEKFKPVMAYIINIEGELNLFLSEAITKGDSQRLGSEIFGSPTLAGVESDHDAKFKELIQSVENILRKHISIS